MKKLFLAFLLLVVSVTSYAQKDSKTPTLPLKEDANGIPVYLSVLRVYGKVVDITPLPRDRSNQVDRTYFIYHRFDRSILTAEQALELVDKYGFSTSNGFLTKTIHASDRLDTKFPSFLTRTEEEFRLK